MEPKSIVVSDNVQTLGEVTAEAASEFDQEKFMSVSSKAASVCSVLPKRKVEKVHEIVIDEDAPFKLTDMQAEWPIRRQYI